MDTNDDPITIAGIALPLLMSKKAKKSDGIPELPPLEKKKTAQPVEQLSEAAKKNRRLAASFLTSGFSTPKLGAGGLLGMTG